MESTGGATSRAGQDRVRLNAAPGFEAPVLHELRHELTMRPDDFIGMAFTASYVRALAPEDQARFREEIAGLLERHGFTGAQPFTIPYRIDCWIARRSTP